MSTTTSNERVQITPDQYRNLVIKMEREMEKAGALACAEFMRGYSTRDVIAFMTAAMPKAVAKMLGRSIAQVLIAQQSDVLPKRISVTEMHDIVTRDIRGAINWIRKLITSEPSECPFPVRNCTREVIIELTMMADAWHEPPKRLTEM